VQSLLTRTGQQSTYDAGQRAPHFSYNDGGLAHDVSFTDSQSLGERIALAHSTGVGIGLWRLGDEDPAVWNDPLLAPGYAW
jgi:spore germination protein YaaH